MHVDEIDELLSIRAAELYYEENKTQDEIGQALRLTRWKVGRLLAQAKQRGFIRIEILQGGCPSNGDCATSGASTTRSSSRPPACTPPKSCRSAPRRPLPTISRHSGRCRAPSA